MCNRSPRWSVGCAPFLFPLDLARTLPSFCWIPIAFSQSPLDPTRNPPLLIGVLERLHLFLLDGLWLQRSVKCACSGAAVWLHNLANKVSNFYCWNISLLPKFFCREVTFWILHAPPVFFCLENGAKTSQFMIVISDLSTKSFKFNLKVFAFMALLLWFVAVIYLQRRLSVRVVM